MRGRLRAIVELVLAVAAAAGCVATWTAGQSTMDVAPIADGEPATTSITYYAPLLLLAFVLATLAGILAVVGIARLRRARCGKRSIRDGHEIERGPGGDQRFTAEAGAELGE